MNKACFPVGSQSLSPTHPLPSTTQGWAGPAEPSRRWHIRALPGSPLHRAADFYKISTNLIMTGTPRLLSVSGVGRGGGEEGELKQMGEQGHCSRFRSPAQLPCRFEMPHKCGSFSDFLPSVFKPEVSWFGSCQTLIFLFPP